MDERLSPDVIEALLAFVEQTTDFVGVSDPWGRILYLNPAAQKRLSEIGGTDLTLADLFPADSFAFYYEVVRPELLRHGAWSGEVLVNAAGAGAVPMYVSTTAKVGPGGETKGGVVLAHDLTQADLAIGVQEAEVDAVTGVLNRRGFVQRLHVALTASDGSGQGCALVLVHIDDVSGTFQIQSASTAATVLRALAGRLTRLARTIDLVGCVSSAELALLVRGVRSHAEMMRIARMVHDELVAAPVETPEGSIRASVRCGAAFSQPGDDAEALIRRASASSGEMTHGGPIAIASEETPSNADVPAGLITLDELRVGMSHGHIWPYVQPIVDLASDDVVGYRGFPRWHHRILGGLEPDAWSDIARRSELAPIIELYVAREVAAAVLVSTRDVPLRQYTRASKQLIADVHTEQRLAEIAEAFFLTMHQIHLEISPSTLEDWSPGLDDALQALREADISIVLSSVDDVAQIEGFANCGFSEVHTTPRLVHDAPTDAGAREALRAITQFGHDRGLLVAAVGVDAAIHRDQAVEAGCDLATGDLYGLPEPAKAIG